jgi:hypothetical protein
MVKSSPETRSHAGRTAVLTRHRGADDPATIEARRDLKAASAEQYIRGLVDAAPRLSSEQRDRLATLLRPGGRTPDSGEAT